MPARAGGGRRCRDRDPHDGRIAAIVELIPAAWLGDEPRFGNVADHRAAYVAYLHRRLAAPRAFVEEAEHARAHLV